MSEEKLPPHWIEENKRPKSYMWVCSECGSTAYDMPMCSKKRYVKICSLAYCPHCGAKMVGEQEVRSREMNEEKLKPCPFCGGEAELEINGLYWDVNCKRCLANVGAYKCYNKKQAVEAWNKRVADIGKTSIIV